MKGRFEKRNLQVDKGMPKEFESLLNRSMEIPKYNFAAFTQPDNLEIWNTIPVRRMLEEFYAQTSYALNHDAYGNFVETK